MEGLKVHVISSLQISRQPTKAINLGSIALMPEVAISRWFSKAVFWQFQIIFPVQKASHILSTCELNSPVIMA